MTDRYSYHIHSAMCRPRQRTRMNRDSLVEMHADKPLFYPQLYLCRN